MKRRRRDDQPRIRMNWDWKKIPDFFRKHPWVFYPLGTLAVVTLMATILIIVLSRNLPSLTELERYDPFLVTRIYSADGKILKELFKQHRIQVPLDRMPENLIQATIATEDRRFWNHWGLDFRRILKAAFVDITTMSKGQGAGTLTGQLARKLYLTSEKRWSRKIREALTALQIERTYSKPEILDMYLNHMWFGHGAYGVQAASLRYFRKNVEDLKPEESALLIGILQLPAAHSPINHPESALRRRNIVLRSMVDCGYMAKAECDSLSKIPLGSFPEENEGETIAPYFCEYVRKILDQKYGDRLYTGGFSIYTTLDTRIQACAENAVNTFIPTLEKNIHAKILTENRFAKWLQPSMQNRDEFNTFMSDTTRVDSLVAAKATVQAALVALNSTNGQILAWVGGRDFEASKWNRVVQSARQPGSSFKPIVYTVAIDNGYAPSYEILNQPVVMIMPDGSRWSPHNFDGSTGGLTPLREAIRRSLNLVTVRLVQDVTPPDKVARYAENFGYTTTIHPYDAIALGVSEVTLLDHTSAYSVFANQGVWVEPTAILRVEDKDGNIIEEAIPKHREVIGEATAYIMTDMLETSINAGTGVTARSVYGFYRPAAGKTGTTNDFTDAWFVGFTPQITAGVWVGFDDPELSLGDNQTGAATALPIWAPFMKATYDSLELPLADFSMPPDVVRVRICAESKKLATESCPQIWDEVFKREMAPTEPCPIHQRPGSSREKKSNPERVPF
jgi:penicillin-binding protein 1A